MRALLLCLPLPLLLTGCGEPDCQSSCDRLFGDGPDQCALQVPDTPAEEMIRSCLAHCNDALSRTGEVGDYAPNARPTGGSQVSLANEQQAALWMDCVAETACENLEEGVCAPTRNFP